MLAVISIKRIMSGLLFALPFLLFAHDFAMAAYDDVRPVAAQESSNSDPDREHPVNVNHPDNHGSALNDPEDAEQPVHCPESNCPAMETCGFARVLLPGTPRMEFALLSVQPAFESESAPAGENPPSLSPIRAEPGRDILTKIHVLTI